MCFGGGSNGNGTTTQNVTSSVQLPPYLDKATQDLISQAQPAAAQQYPFYDAPRIAPMTSDQLSGMQLARGNVGSYQPYLQAANTAAASGGSSIQPGQIQNYLDPYLKNVQQSGMDLLQKQYQQDALQRQSQEAFRGTFNNSTSQIIENDAQRQRDIAQGNFLAQTGSQGFGQALSAAQSDQSRQLQAAQIYGNLAPTASQLGYQDAAAQLAVGGTQQAATQQNLNLAYQDFLNQFQYPQNQLSWLSNIIRGTPAGQTQQSQQVLPAANGLAGFLGGLGSTASLANSIIPGGLASLFSGGAAAGGAAAAGSGIAGIGGGAALLAGL